MFFALIALFPKAFFIGVGVLICIGPAIAEGISACIPKQTTTRTTTIRTKE